MLRLAIHTQGENPKVLEFPYDHRVTFGRSETNDVCLPPSYVSREHGEFLFEGGEWWVVDHGSLTGVAVLREGESPVQIPGGGRERLRPGDTIQILHTLIRVEAKPIEALVETDQDWWEGGTIASVRSTARSSLHSLQEELRGNDEQLERLFALASDLSGLADLRDVLRRIAASVFEMLPTASHFSICVPEVDGDGAFVPFFGVLRGGEELEVADIRVSQSILGWVAMRQVAMLFQPGEGDAVLSESIVSAGIASSMAVPLHSPRGPVGVMQVDNRASDVPFAQRDLNLMIVLANGAASALERARFQADIQGMFDGFVEASVIAIESRDPTTSGHSRRVADYCVELARAVNRTERGPLAGVRFEEAELTELSYAAMLHDFGKVGVRECVLLKAERLYPEQVERIDGRFREIRAARRTALLCEELGRGPDAAIERVDAAMAEVDRELLALRQLITRMSRHGPRGDADLERLAGMARRFFTDEAGERRPFLLSEELAALSIRYGTLTVGERREIESHVLESHRILEQIPWSGELARVPEIVVAHHEKLDGSGYPHALGRDEIPVQARLLSVCDVFDAVTASDRPYRSALPADRGIAILRSDAAEGALDPDFVDLFVEVRPWQR